MLPRDKVRWMLPCLAPLILGGLQVSAEQSFEPAGPVFVDFYVFKGDDGDLTGVAPQASMNIGGSDMDTGFWKLCASKCSDDAEPGSGSPGQLRFCPCVAEHLVEDLNSDFGALPGAKVTWELGNYKEFAAGQGLYDILDGHGALRALMNAKSDNPVHRDSGRLTVWVANHIAGSAAHTELAGTTYLDQPLYGAQPGAAVLLQGSVSRMGKRLSHEVGHVVGFHHVAGPPITYTYQHSECEACGAKVSWRLLASPDCEPNIMGAWYDGPYCCPWPEEAGAGAAASFLQRTAARKKDQCTPNSMKLQKSPWCCGSSCGHDCPVDMPAFTFATSQHRETLGHILQCWQHLRGMPPTGFSPNGTKASAAALVATPPRARVECADYGEELGPCVSISDGA